MKIKPGDVLEDWTGPRPRVVQINRQVRVRVRILALRLINRFGRGRVTGDAEAVVSLTTYGSRIEKVYIALESIAAGLARPSRLILWLDDDDQFENPPKSLRRLQARGLEIRKCEDFGPHKKYFPYVLENGNFVEPLVTADDDIVYPRWWLDGLVRAHLKADDQIHCYRAHRIIVDQGTIAPYATWPRGGGGPASILNFSTGVSGAVLPPRFLDGLRARGSGFLDVCPKADDIWLHETAVRIDCKVHQVLDEGLHFNVVPGTQADALMHANVTSGANDVQVAATYSADDIRRLMESH